MPLFLYEDVHEILVCIATESIEGSGESVYMRRLASIFGSLSGRRCYVHFFYTFEKTRFKICRLLKIRFAI